MSDEDQENWADPGIGLIAAVLLVAAAVWWFVQLTSLGSGHG